MKDKLCDPISGICTPAEINANTSQAYIDSSHLEIIYVGDPMCSWCWGIAPALRELKEHYAKENLGFRVVAGGLRPGGGDVWNEQFKDFLRHHWEEVNKRSGQPFSYSLFDKAHFDYDTEPSCRAVVTASAMEVNDTLAFFEAVQRKFYVHNEDPNQTAFYHSLCTDFQLDFDTFQLLFESDSMRLKTNKEFMQNREWGVRGYPCVLLKKENTLYPLTYGYATFQQMKNQLETIRTK